MGNILFIGVSVFQRETKLGSISSHLKKMTPSYVTLPLSLSWEFISAPPHQVLRLGNVHTHKHTQIHTDICLPCSHMSFTWIYIWKHTGTASHINVKHFTIDLLVLTHQRTHIVCTWYVINIIVLKYALTHTHTHRGALICVTVHWPIVPPPHTTLVLHSLLPAVNWDYFTSCKFRADI